VLFSTALSRNLLLKAGYGSVFCACALEFQVMELFVDKVHQIVYFKEMGIRSKQAAIGFAEKAVKHLYRDGMSINAEQDTKGGIMLHK